jgi:hypothetical protein
MMFLRWELDTGRLHFQKSIENENSVVARARQTLLTKMEDPVVGVVPKFLLRGIDPKVLSEKYYAGEYANVSEPPSAVFNLQEVNHVSIPNYGNNPDLPCYEFKDKNNISVVIITSNNGHYKFFQKKEVLKKGGRCFWCLQDFDHERTPVPIRMEKKIDPKTNESYYFFWTEGILCNPQCALAYAKREALYDPLYKDSEFYLQFWHGLLHPHSSEKFLIPAPDYRLLKANEGHLDIADYRKNIYDYQRSTNTILIPAKVEYFQDRVD